jgi:hypothetical protein
MAGMFSHHRAETKQPCVDTPPRSVRQPCRSVTPGTIVDDGDRFGNFQPGSTSCGPAKADQLNNKSSPDAAGSYLSFHVRRGGWNDGVAAEVQTAWRIKDKIKATFRYRFASASWRSDRDAVISARTSAAL